jgi:ribonuclease P/MRP protein subunit POP5
MAVRPPTLRDKRRYLLIRVDPAGTPVEQKELYLAISDAITSLWGDAAASLIQQAVVAAEGQYAMVRCRRGTERELAVALSTVTSCRDVKLALRIIAASGTLESLRERIRSIPVNPADDTVPRVCRFGGNEFDIAYCSVQKVDVIEKGFKNTNRLFLTREDLEES